MWEIKQDLCQRNRFAARRLVRFGSNLALIYCTEPHLKIAEVLQHFSERAIEHSIERVQCVFSITLLIS